MDSWTVESVEKTVLDFEKLLLDQQNGLVAYLNQKFPPWLYVHQRELWARALINTKNAKQVLSGAVQKFPPYLNNGIPHRPEDLAKCAISLRRVATGSG